MCLHTHILRVLEKNGVSLPYIMLEVHHSGQEPLIYCILHSQTYIGHPLEVCAVLCQDVNSFMMLFQLQIKFFTQRKEHDSTTLKNVVITPLLKSRHLEGNMNDNL